MAIAVNTRKKNSGILRYSFGTADGAVEGQFGPLVGQAAANILVCLGADLDVTPDEDNQVFGEFPGHAAIVGSAASSSLFSGSNVVQRDGIQPAGSLMNPQTGNFPATGGRYPAFIPAYESAPGFNQLNPGATKVHAYFQATDIDFGLSTAPGDVPAVVVQTEVKTNRFYRGGVLDTVGAVYVSSIRVAIRNLSPSTTIAAGILIVELQHSEHDIPGGLLTDQNFSTITPG